jgi:DNA-directed RNA polymerase subunit RPC12/RpoP
MPTAARLAVPPVIEDEIEEDFGMYKTGQKPGKGTYQCIACGQLVVLDDRTDTLPPCPKCNNTSHIKIR